MRMRYISVERDRHGTDRVYFRHGRRRIRIRETPGSPEFAQRYAELREAAATGTWARVLPPTPADTRPVAGTFGWLCTAYMHSAAFLALDESTRRVRRRHLDLMMLEPQALSAGAVGFSRQGKRACSGIDISDNG
jgi:hypothetical protein